MNEPKNEQMNTLYGQTNTRERKAWKRMVTDEKEKESKNMKELQKLDRAWINYL